MTVVHSVALINIALRFDEKIRIAEQMDDSLKCGKLDCIAFRNDKKQWNFFECSRTFGILSSKIESINLN